MQEYSSIKELYQTLIPAFNVKLRMIKNSEFSYIEINDLWEYLKDTIWSKSVDLTIAQMVSNIINVNIKEVDIYIKSR